jgi:hypothetical protein
VLFVYIATGQQNLPDAREKAKTKNKNLVFKNVIWAR